MLTNYGFMIEGVLAGSALPGSCGPLMEDLQEAREAGITAVVTLTETPLQAAMLRESGMKYLHLAVEDFAAPTISQVEEFVAFVEDVRREGGAVLVHCRAGYGRTGTMLAAYLIRDGVTAAEAIRRVRQARPGSIETSRQERLLQQYEAKLKTNRA